MKTNVLPHVEPLHHDENLMSDLAEHCGPAPQQGPALSVGIEGPDGEVYRVIESRSVCETVRIFEALRRNGLVADEGREAGGKRLLRVFRARDAA